MSLVYQTGPAAVKIVERIKTTQAREEFGSVIAAVAYGGRWVVFHRRGRDLAAMVPMADLHRLQTLLHAETLPPAWDGLSPLRGDWIEAERVRRNLEVDDMR